MSGKVRWNWYGDKIKQQLEDEASKRIQASAIAVHNHAKKLISVDGTGRAIKTVSYSYGGRRRVAKKKGLIYGFAPSQPGEPPRVQFGRLRGSIAWEMATRFIARVGTNVKYGRWLELGTKFVQSRPWLRRALVEMRPRIQALMRKPFKFR